MVEITTTHGSIPVHLLTRTLGFEDRPSEFVVWVEWRLPEHPVTACEVCANPDNPRPSNGMVLFRRDAHCILKEGSVVADAIASSV